MKKFVTGVLLALAAGLTPTEPAAGQGGVIDWIHRLSGPSMLGPSVSYFWDTPHLRIRISGSGRFAVGFRDRTIEDGHSVNMFALQPTVEVPLCEFVELGGGFAVNRLGGDGHDSFWHVSFPFYGQYRRPVDDAQRWFLRIGIGGHIFPKFDESDFLGPEDPLPGVQVETSRREVTLGLILGFDYKRG